MRGHLTRAHQVNLMVRQAESAFVDAHPTPEYAAMLEEIDRIRQRTHELLNADPSLLPSQAERMARAEIEA